MKQLLTIILLLVTLAGNAQLNLHNKNAWHTLEAVATSVVLNASADALRDNGHKDWSHALEAASYVPLLSIPFIDKDNGNSFLKNTLITVGMYAGTRVLGYDYTYNAVRGLPLNYMGTTSGWDKTLHDIGRSPIAPLFRTVFFTFTVSFGFDNL